MPIDPSIPLQVQQADIGGGLLQFATLKKAQEDRARRNKLIDLQTQETEIKSDEFKKDAPNRAAASANERELALHKSLTMASLRLKPYLDVGDIEGAKNYALQRKAMLEEVGYPTTETDNFIKILDSDPARAKSIVDEGIARGQQLGFLKAPEKTEGFTLGQGQKRFDVSGKEIAAVAPDKSGRGEYIVPVNTAEGVKGFDTRRGIVVDPVTRKQVETPVIRSQDDPTLQGKLTGTKKQSEEAGKLYNETVDNSLKISDQIEVAKEGIDKLLKYTKSSAGGTGPFATAFGTKRLVSADLQDLEANFNKINLKNLVTTFQGFSRSIDTAVERGAWDRTQPNIKLDDPVNLNILIGNISLGAKAAAEGEARKQFIENSPGKNLEGYKSPIIGKTKTMFNQNGEVQLIPNDQSGSYIKQGWMNADQYAKFLTKGKPSLGGEVIPTKNGKGWVLHEDAQGNKAYVGPNGQVEEVQ